VRPGAEQRALCEPWGVLWGKLMGTGGVLLRGTVRVLCGYCARYCKLCVSLGTLGQVARDKALNSELFDAAISYVEAHRARVRAL